MARRERAPQGAKKQAAAPPLERIQREIGAYYDVDVSASVEDFVCDEEVAREAVGEAVERREVLLVAEEPDGVAIGLYVAADAVEQLQTQRDAWMDASTFEAACLATEGVSHFVYLMFRAQNAESVSQLELELQAEVDKYAMGLLAGNGVGAIIERSRSLRTRLFEGVEFIDGEGSDEGERYRLANRLAGRYARRLEARYVARGDLDALARELRRFYRLGAREKLETTGER